MAWHWFNWVVIGLYFLGILMLGFYFSKNNVSTEDYFTASGRVPSWVTACSIYATALSSISFIAIPASVYNNGWLLGMAPLGIILMVIWAAVVFVPFFRRVNVVTAYEYLGKRFDNKFRLIGSLSFVLFHVIRMAVVLYLPTLALMQALPNLNPYILTAIVAILCVAYTSMGGIEAVLWSDAIQTIVLLSGAFLIIIFGFAAAQSTVSSSLNSVSTCMTADLLEQFKPGMSDADKLSFAKKSSWAVGIVSTILAMRFIQAGQGDMFLYFQAITGLLGGPIAGVFLVGIFFDKVNTKAVWCGFIVSVIIATYLGNPAGLLTKFIPGYVQPKVFEFLISLIIIGSNVAVSLIASLFTGKPTLEHIKGLTYASIKNMEEK